MPRLLFFRASDGSVPFLEWLDDLPERANMACLGRAWKLAELGHRLRRPAADYLRDGIYELRIKSDLVQYRVLYFFHGRAAVVISHGILKQQEKIPPIEIDRATRRKAAFEANPAAHFYEAEI